MNEIASDISQAIVYGEGGQRQVRWISCPISMTSSAFSSLLPKNSRVPLVKTALGAIA
jgi:hypothetical protein